MGTIKCISGINLAVLFDKRVR